MRLKTLTLLLLILALPLSASIAQFKKLSENAKISLLTCGPGEAVWSKFGHSALWVFDPVQGIDRVYNYGTFDFYSNDFYMQFVKGTANYRLSVTNYLDFHNEYEGENRSIRMQELNLTDSETQVLFDKLEENYKPENRYYRYDFLFLNCSSIVRDIVWEATSGRYTIPAESEIKYTYRSMMIPYLSGNPWLMNGEFILLGYKTDHDANPWNQMYLPDYMFNWFEAAVNTDNESLVRKTQTLFLPRPSDTKKPLLSHPYLILPVILLLIILLTYQEIISKKTNRIVDSIIFFATGLMGLLMVYTWTSSLHIVLHENMNMVWAFPLHVFIAILVWMNKSHPLIRIYARIMAPLTIIFLCFFWLLPQAIPPVAVLSSAIIGVRLARWAYFPVK